MLFSPIYIVNTVQYNIVNSRTTTLTLVNAIFLQAYFQVNINSGAEELYAEPKPVSEEYFVLPKLMRIWAPRGV